MSIMDRETFIRQLNNNALPVDILYEYCLEKGKKTEEITQFVIAIKAIDPFGNLLDSCMMDAIRYYRNKFNVISITDTTGKIIINY